MADDVSLCAHISPGGWPFEVRLVLDEQMGFTDAVVDCRRCGRAYLLEMLDWRGSQRAMRVSPLAADRVEVLLKHLGRSCDVARAGAEIHHLRTSSRFAPYLLLLDTSRPVIEAVAPVAERLPGGSWRELPCDGTWIDYARSNSEMRSG